MGIHPMLNLNDVVPDLELVNQVPHTLALYYLALPLAQEDGRVSVAMAHPENTTALAILSRLLGTPIVPVRSAAAAIRNALQTLRPSQTIPTAGILGWSARAEWAAAVETWTQALGALLNSSATLLRPAPITFGDCLTAASEGRYKLTVLDLPPESSTKDVLRWAMGPLFLVRSADLCPLRRILVVLRGFSSDEQVLDWAISLAHEETTTLTLMLLGDGRFPIVQEALAANGCFQQPLGVTSHRPHLDDLRTYLKVRQGHPIRQIGDEAAEGQHDLILISAEGDGAFVARVLAELERQDVHKGRPILVLKPTL